MFQNIVIGTPLVDASMLLAKDMNDWRENERRNTLFTATRFLPAIMKECGIVSSTSEVRRNRPELAVTLDKLDCFMLKWGKKQVYIVVGE